MPREVIGITQGVFPAVSHFPALSGGLVAGAATAKKHSLQQSQNLGRIAPRDHERVSAA
jgi:hypothetical protein